uniref:Uncharacterized protein n=1 Tax=Melanthalia intermedia TaxID=172989 RepID=A0A345UB23_9FLOR|nr:hypothetical protein [Melanthalia intermedia]AXI97659.1 hypothetical protein [Melanthalia intermedia]
MNQKSATKDVSTPETSFYTNDTDQKISLLFSQIRKLEEKKIIDSQSMRKMKKREQQRAYTRTKRMQGYHNMNFWLKCNPELSKKLKHILTHLSEEEISKIVNDYIQYLSLF